MPRSIAVGRDHFTTLERDEAAESDDVDRVPDEANTSITHQHVDAARVIGEQFIVGTGVVAGGIQPVGCQADCSYVGRYLLLG